MQTVHLKNLKKKFELNRKSFRFFITRLENNPPVNLDATIEKIDKQVWREINCLKCANCCKVMSPTYTKKDIGRISTYLNVSEKHFTEKWLYLDKRDNDWMNKSTPCQFLDLKSNKCSIYEVRPMDCSEFPHFIKKPASDYLYIHKQNIEYCPATMLMMEKLKKLSKRDLFHL